MTKDPSLPHKPTLTFSAGDGKYQQHADTSRGSRESQLLQKQGREMEDVFDYRKSREDGHL